MKRPRFASEIIEENRVLRRRVRALRKALRWYEGAYFIIEEQANAVEQAKEFLRRDAAVARGAK